MQLLAYLLHVYLYFCTSDLHFPTLCQRNKHRREVLHGSPPWKEDGYLPEKTNIFIWKSLIWLLNTGKKNLVLLPKRRSLIQLCYRMLFSLKYIWMSQQSCTPLKFYDFTVCPVVRGSPIPISLCTKLLTFTPWQFEEKWF